MFLRAAAFRADAFAARFLGAEVGVTPEPTPDEQGVLLRPGGITHNRRSKAAKDTRRRRILLENGQIIVPRDDDEYRMIVEQIVAGFEPAAVPEPAKRRRRRVKGAVVAPPPVPRLAPVSALPGEFYNALEQHRVGVLNYLSILAAWQAYLAEMDEDEAVTLLLMN